jgi:hypothetical protein
MEAEPASCNVERGVMKHAPSGRAAADASLAAVAAISTAGGCAAEAEGKWILIGTP